MTETTVEATQEPTPTVQESQADIDPAAVTEPAGEPATFSADYVKALREESAAHRVKSKRIDEANERLLRIVVASDGRLINADELTLVDELLDDTGITDPGKVAKAIGDLITSKPYLAARRPTTTIPQGVKPQNEPAPSLFQMVQDRI